MGMPRGKSSAFPINGRPLGPGGYGSLDLLRESRGLKYLASAISKMVAPRGTAKGESIVVSPSMMQGPVRMGGFRRPATVV